MFDGIAGSYDRLNDLMTAGLHHRWREMAVMVARVGPGDSALDVCCGTGDFAFELRRAVGRRGGWWAWTSRRRCSTSPGRSAAATSSTWSSEWRRARSALSRRAAGRWPRAGGDGAARGCGFDACTVGFGIRNVPDIVRAFSEMRRVCRPGGRVVCLEITQLAHPGVQAVLRALVRSGRARAGPAGRPGRDRLHVSAGVGAALSRRRGAEGLDGGGRPARTCATRSWPGGSSPASRCRPGVGGVC